MPARGKPTAKIFADGFDGTTTGAGVSLQGSDGVNVLENGAAGRLHGGARRGETPELAEGEDNDGGQGEPERQGVGGSREFSGSEWDGAHVGVLVKVDGPRNVLNQGGGKQGVVGLIEEAVAEKFNVAKDKHAAAAERDFQEKGAGVVTKEYARRREVGERGGQLLVGQDSLQRELSVLARGEGLQALARRQEELVDCGEKAARGRGLDSLETFESSILAPEA
jgi:hypothetical protein